MNEFFVTSIIIWCKNRDLAEWIVLITAVCLGLAVVIGIHYSMTTPLVIHCYEDTDKIGNVLITYSVKCADYYANHGYYLYQHIQPSFGSDSYEMHPNVLSNNIR